MKVNPRPFQYAMREMKVRCPIRVMNDQEEEGSNNNIRVIYHPVADIVVSSTINFQVINGNTYAMLS